MRHTHPADANTVSERTISLGRLCDIITYRFPGMQVLSASLMGSYAYPWITTTGSDIDINVIFNGEGFRHCIIPITEIPRGMRLDIPPGIDRLEVVTIGAANAASGRPVNDSFSGATRHGNVVGIITSGLWNRDVPVFGADYRPIENNSMNLLRLSYDLIESAIRRYFNIEMERPEPEVSRLRKSIGRNSEAMSYLEEIRMQLAGNHRRVFLPRESEEKFTDDEVRFYSAHVMGDALSRYMKVRAMLGA